MSQEQYQSMYSDYSLANSRIQFAKGALVHVLVLDRHFHDCTLPAVSDGLLVFGFKALLIGTCTELCITNKKITV